MPAAVFYYLNFYFQSVKKVWHVAVFALNLRFRNPEFFRDGIKAVAEPHGV